MTPSCENRQGKNREAPPRYRMWGHAGIRLATPCWATVGHWIYICSGSISEDRFSCIARQFHAPTTFPRLVNIGNSVTRPLLPTIDLGCQSILEVFSTRLIPTCRSVFMPLVIFTGEGVCVCLCLMIRPPSGSRNGFPASG